MRWVAIIAFLSATISAQVSSGGDFSLEKIVVSSGGGTSSDSTSTLKITGTIGQGAAGQATTNPFAIYLGFWTPDVLGPTAARVKISGRLVTDTGRPISNTTITLTASDGSIVTTRSSTFGYFVLANVEVGDTYVLNLSSRRYVFTNIPMIIAVNDEIADLQIVGSLP